MAYRDDCELFEVCVDLCRSGLCKRFPSAHLLLLITLRIALNCEILRDCSAAVNIRMEVADKLL
jgi:hypothetical protein